MCARVKSLIIHLLSYFQYLKIIFFSFIIISDKIPDDKNFKNGSKGRQIWDADDIDEAYRNDTGMFTHNNGHVKFDSPKVPVIFVLGKKEIQYRCEKFFKIKNVRLFRWTWKR